MRRAILVLLSAFIIIYLMLFISYGNNKKISNEKSNQIFTTKNERELFIAVQNNDILSAKKLIEMGVNINVKDNVGETALEKAVKTDNKNIVEFLISKGSDLNTMDIRKSTPLSVIKSKSMMNLLLSKGANTDTMVFAGYGEDDEKAIEVAEYIVSILPNESSDIAKVVTEPSIGMTANEMLNTTWGTPEKKNKTISTSGTSEQWIYPNYRYVYLDKGIVTSIQTP